MCASAAYGDRRRTGPIGFQPDAVRDKWRNRLAEFEDKATLSQFVKTVGLAALMGQAEPPHRHTACPTEISSPVTTPGGQVFALSLLYLNHGGSDDFMVCRAELSQSAWQITQTLRGQQASPERNSHRSQSVQTAETADNIFS